MSDLISRQAALEAIQARADMELADINHNYLMGLQEAAEAVESVPDAQPGLDEWCTDCKEYDHEKHHCPRWNRVIREALKDAQPEKRTEKRTETHACDLIDRQAAIDALHMHLMYRMGTDSNKKRLDDWINSLPSAQPERKWTSCSNPPKHHKDVIVRGIEAIGNVTVHKVMQWDVDTWRPTDYAPSVMWKEWSEI